MTRTELLRELHTTLPRRPHIAEIGVLRGTFTTALVSILDPARLLLVDPWRVLPRSEYADYRELTPARWDAIYTRVRTKFGDRTGCQIIRSLSMEAAPQVASASLDFVYLDANHAYPCIQADLAAWVPKVKPGGVVAGHDYDQPGVRRAVAEYRAGAPYQLTTEKSCNTYWWTV